MPSADFFLTRTAGLIRLSLMGATAFGLGLGVCSAQTPPAPAPAPEYVINVSDDHADGLYHVGETATFAIETTHLGQPAANEEVFWTVSKGSGTTPLQSGKTTLADGKGTVSAKLDEPGFLLCTVDLKHEKATLTGLGGAAFDPLLIKPSLPAPDDFDAFWATQKAALAAIPINAKLTSVTPTRPDVEAFDVQADCVGQPMSGYYARPVGAKPKSLPAMVIFHGAGVDSANLDQVCGWAKAGVITLDINAHGLPNGKPREFYQGLATGDLKDYRTRGAASRDTYYFLGMYLRVLRALDFVTSQPEWDGRTLISNGGSQGGAQAIVGAGLDPRVNLLIAAVPAMCDHSGNVVGRAAGWPKLVPLGADGKPNPALLEPARYFDSVNFAGRTQADAFFSVGFIDVVCPASTVYAAYNNLQGKKEIMNDLHGGHSGDPRPTAPNVWAEARKRVLNFTAANKATASAP